MSRSIGRTVTVDVDVDVDLENFDTDDLIDELERRGSDYNTQGVDGDLNREILEQIWLKRRMNQPFEAELDQLIWNVVGRIS
jgi:hypothetical protein